MALNLGKIAKAALKTVAPLAATALGGPVGGIATKLITEALGTDDEAVIEQKLADGDPATLVALKNIDKDLQLEMKRLGIQHDEVFLSDRKDARGLAAKLGKIWPQFTIFITLSFIMAGVIYMLLYVQIPEANRPILFMLLGNTVTAWLASIYFFTGTSKGSQDKNFINQS